MLFSVKQPSLGQAASILPAIKTTYKTVSGTGLPIRIYLPSTPRNSNETDPFFLMIHGGAWQAIHKTDTNWNGGFMDYQARYYAAMGFRSAAISYRSIDFEASTTMHDLITDCQDAIVFLKEQFSLQKLILMGDSAGAHLALSLAFRGISEISAVIAANPVVDCTLERWHFTAPTRQERAAISPLFRIQPVAPKILCLHGDADTTVDYRQTKEFCEKMEQAGSLCDFLLIPGASHAFLLMGYRSDAIEVQHYMSIIDKWLDDHL